MIVVVLRETDGLLEFCSCVLVTCLRAVTAVLCILSRLGVRKILLVWRNLGSVDNRFLSNETLTFFLKGLTMSYFVNSGVFLISCLDGGWDACGTTFLNLVNYPLKICFIS